jgi:hypothetical protein
VRVGTAKCVDFRNFAPRGTGVASSHPR